MVLIKVAGAHGPRAKSSNHTTGRTIRWLAVGALIRTLTMANSFPRTAHQNNNRPHTKITRGHTSSKLYLYQRGWDCCEEQTRSQNVHAKANRRGSSCLLSFASPSNIQPTARVTHLSLPSVKSHTHRRIVVSPTVSSQTSVVFISTKIVRASLTHLHRAKPEPTSLAAPSAHRRESGFFVHRLGRVHSPCPCREHQHKWERQEQEQEWQYHSHQPEPFYRTRRQKRQQRRGCKQQYAH